MREGILNQMSWLNKSLRIGTTQSPSTTSQRSQTTFETWRDLLYKEEGLYSDVFREVDLLAGQVWNYGYFKMRFAVDDFHLDRT
jgi:hypothetical protein